LFFFPGGFAFAYGGLPGLHPHGQPKDSMV